MPILSRKTRRLLRLLFGLKRKSKLDLVFWLLPFLVWGGLIVWYQWWGDGENQAYVYGVAIYLYVDIQFRRLESDGKEMRERTRKMMTRAHSTELSLKRVAMRGGDRVKVDVNDMFTEGEKWKQNQARHRAQRG